MSPLQGTARFEVTTCLSECEKAPVVRVRFDDAEGRRVSALLSGSGRRDLAVAVRAWVESGAPAPLPPELSAAEFLPGEGGGCLCDELEEPPVP